MYPIGKMISLSPQEEILPALEPILSPFLIELQQLTGQAQSAQVKTRLMYLLKVLTTLFQALCLNNSNKNKSPANSNSQQEPATVLMPQIVPILKSVADKWIEDEEVMDAIWMLIKQTAGTLVENGSNRVVIQVCRVSIH